MDRLPDWPDRLRRSLRERLKTPFQWGVNDCATFAADCVLAQTGVDFADGLRGAYSSEEEASELLADRGWFDLPGLADAFLERRNGRHLRGDVVLLRGAQGAFLAVSLGGDVAIAPAGNRARQFRTSRKTSAGEPMLIASWAVG